MTRKKSKTKAKQELHKLDTKKLTNEERLELSNIQLRRQMIEAQVKGQMNQLQHKEDEIVAGIDKRLKINLKEWRADLDSGNLIRIPPPPPPPPLPKPEKVAKK